MKLFLLLFLVACQPEMKPRSLVSAGAIGESGDSLLGTWKSDLGSCYILAEEEDYPCSSEARITITETTFKAVVINVETGLPFNKPPLRFTSIRFMSASSFYDYQLNETVTFEVNGNSASLCYDVECENLTRL